MLQEGVLDEALLHIPCVDGQTNQPGVARVQVPFAWREADLLPGHEYFLNLAVTLKEDSGLLPAGHVVAIEQYALHPALPAAEAEGPLPALSCARENGQVVLAGADFTLVFDEVLGRLVQYTAAGRELIVPGQGPVGNFYRAATDNDTGFGYGLFVFTRPWKDASDYAVDSFTVEAQADRAVVTVTGHYPALNGMVHNTVYTVYGDGAVAADVTIIPNYDKDFVYVPVVGMELMVPGAYEQMTFFGRGPEENYWDRAWGTKVGRYATTVTDNFIGYVRTSETGNRTGVRWIALTDETGSGLLAVGGTPLEVSALHYTALELDRRVHPYELNALADTVLRLNAVQIGVGGDNAWSRIVPHAQYLPHEVEYRYAFTLAPLAAGEDAMEKSVVLRERMTP